MIARLRTTLLALEAALREGDPDRSSAALAADCADALRLQLDCMQEELSPSQRSALHELGEVLEDDRASNAVMAEAIRGATEALETG